tara:strand:+ start:4222 stop:4557 length:336 start_codon:yes stop_codon:yes gene_type:complete
MISLSNDPNEFLAERTFLRDIFSLFMTDQESLDRNLWMLCQRSKGGLDLEKVESLPYWRYEQFVNIANGIAEDEKKERESQEGEQKSGQSNNFNPSGYLNKMSGMAGKFKK